MSGKSVAWKTLMNAKTQMCKDGIDGYHPVSLITCPIVSLDVNQIVAKDW